LNKSFNPYLLPPLLLQWSALSLSDTLSSSCRNNQNFCLPISDALKKSIEEIPNSIHSTKEIRISATTANNNRRERASERARARALAGGRADGRERERERATEWPSKSGHGLWALIRNGDVAVLPNSHLFFLAC